MSTAQCSKTVWRISTKATTGMLNVTVPHPSLLALSKYFLKRQISYWKTPPLSFIPYTQVFLTAQKHTRDGPSKAGSLIDFPLTQLWRYCSKRSIDAVRIEFFLLLAHEPDEVCSETVFALSRHCRQQNLKMFAINEAKYYLLMHSHASWRMYFEDHHRTDQTRTCFPVIISYCPDIPKSRDNWAVHCEISSWPLCIKCLTTIDATWSRRCGRSRT